jgi:hypothetical protein
VTLYGIGFDSLVELRVAGQSVSFDAAVDLPLNSSDPTAVALRVRFPSLVDRLQSLSFVSPSLNESGVGSSFNQSAALHSSYQLLTLDSFFGSADNVTNALPLQLNLSTLLYYSSTVQCQSFGEWLPDGAGVCLPCPVGGECIGGGRVRPLKGYWSFSEFEAPVKCRREGACAGYDSDEAALAASCATDAVQSPANLVATLQCADGYTRAGCAACANGFHQLNGQCVNCGPAASAGLGLTLLIGLALLVALAVAVAVLPPTSLASLVHGILLLQFIALIGVSGARNSSHILTGGSAFFTYVSLSSAPLRVSQLPECLACAISSLMDCPLTPFLCLCASLFSASS